MAQANFSFISDASGGDQFTVVSFSGNEAISSLYQYEIEIKSPLSAEIDLDDVLDNPARFVTELDGKEYPVYGVLSSFDELQTVQGYVYYQAVLVPKLWWLSIYKTNEIYTEEKTVDMIIQAVLENADFTSGTDFDLGGLDTSKFLKRDYVCQFGESDFDFISRLMENEGIFYYFEHDSGSAEKIIFINDMNYLKISRPDLIFDVTAQTSLQHDSINAWSCRKQRLPASVTVRDFNPEQPSLDISDTMPIDNMGQGTEYIYGANVRDGEEATYLSEIRAEEQLCSKTRFYGESSVTRLLAGYVFKLKEGHPNSNYNGVEYLTLEVSHEGQHLDMEMSERSRKTTKPTPQYRNSFVAIEATEQYRPPRKTPKPRFFGTMTAFVYAETGKKNAEVDLEGRYRVHLPFDRADGTKDSTDPHRKASTWIRMAQPYVGQDQGMYFPLEDGTEVLLTFINGDPDQPIISSALPNAAQPSLLTSEMNLQRTITAQVSQTVSGNTHTISQNSARIALIENPPPAPDPTALGTRYINEGATQASVNGTPATPTATAIPPAPPTNSMIPPWTGKPLNEPIPTQAYDVALIKFRKYDKDFNGEVMTNADLKDQPNLMEVSTDRNAGDNYVYANARTFAYPQHERVYFIGTFHEDFHVKDDFIIPNDDGTYNSWTGISEQFNFPAPGTKYPDDTNPIEDSDATVNPSGIRGVSEDKRWGDQMFYAFGRSFNWCAGKQMGDGGAFGIFNYGNGYTENLITESSGTSDTISGYKDHKDRWDFTSTWTPSSPGGVAGALGIVNKFAGVITTGVDYARGFLLAVYARNAEFLKTKPSPVGLKAATHLDPAITLTDKTFGHTYSYHMGLAVGIHEGNTITRTYGNTEDMVEGDAESVVKGDSYSTIYGATSGMFLGTKNEVTMGIDNEMKLAADTTFLLGGQFELFAGLKLETNLNATLKLGWSPEFERKGFGIQKADTELNNRLAKIDSTQSASLEKVTARIQKAELATSFLKFDIITGALVVRG